MRTAFNTILDQWAEGTRNRILVSDGAMGTQLMMRGLRKGACPEEWNAGHPGQIADIHRTYYEAGADLVETNTFGGSRIRLEHYGFGDKVNEFNRRAVEIARSVCPQGKFVAGSVGPTGALMEPFGPLSEQQAVDVFAEQVGAMIEAGVDLIIIETMMDLTEISAAVRAVRMLDADIPVVATMTFEANPSGFFTSMGVDPKTACAGLAESDANILGANCGRGVDEMIGIMKVFRAVTTMPLMAQANAGIPRIEGERLVYPETPVERGEAARNLIDLGVNIIGGCCGTTPDHIRAIRAVVDA